MKQTKTMWAILHVPSEGWDGGDSNLLLYWAEYEALVECMRRGGGSDVWRPIKLTVSVAEKGSADGE